MCALADAVPERRIGFRLADVATRASGSASLQLRMRSPSKTIQNIRLTFDNPLVFTNENLSKKDT